IKEIEDAALQSGEEEELEKNYRLMSNSRKIAEVLGEVHRLTGYEDGAGDLVGRASREILQVSDLDESLGGMAASLADIDGLLNDFNREAADFLDSFSFSEEEFYETEKRLDLINTLKAKYGRTTEDVLAYLEEQKAKLEALDHFDEQKALVETRFREAEEALEKASEKLSAKRRAAAEDLSTQIIEGLKELNFLSVDFTIAFERTSQYNKNGFDAIEFLISTNPGESVKPLSKVVSGGELSRIMLAIKTILADRDETETLIFDEIDTGISGRTAQKVSEKMARIGHGHQVLCITHLAQIAAMADRHFVISKQVENGSTTSRIHPLKEEESVEELARILGGAEITDAVVGNAKEMKQLAEKKKSAL
ncbi:MAG: DNA repair protein RecN, partial [Eubacterium sp.]|nr:DNA repair protein RecN [Eubacterium sp.]